MTKLPSRDAVQRFAEIAQRSRESFLAVQEVLQSSDLGPVPSWVFAIDPLPLEEVKAFSEELLRVEIRRRKWKAALLAMAQLIALEDQGRELLNEPPTSTSLTEVDSADEADLHKLDRFITVINAARAGGCIYVNGTFEPVERDTGPPEDKDTFDLPPTREEPPKA